MLLENKPLKPLEEGVPYTPTITETLTREILSKEKQIEFLVKNPLELAKRSFKFFIIKVLNILYPVHYDEWTELARSYSRIVVECARDHSKTYFWAFAYVLWKVSCNPQHEICLISYSQEQAMRLIDKIKEEIERNPYLRILKPKKDATWSKTELHCGNGAKINCESFGTASRGGHYHLIIVDDPLKDFGGINTEDQKRYFFGAVFPMLRPEGQLVVDGTPIEFGDLLEELENNKMFKLAMFPAVKKDGSPLWPERYSLALLEERRKSMPQVLFDREYLLRRITKESIRFRRDWLKHYEELPPDRYNYFIAVDPAINQKEDSDYTAIVTVAVNTKSDWYVVDVVRDRLDPSQIIEKLFLLYFRYRPMSIGIEAVAYQQALVHFAQQTMKERGQTLPLVELKPDTQTKKEMRILGLQPRFENGSIFIKKEMTGLVEEYMSFPRGRTDDVLDALAYISQIFKKPTLLIYERDPIDAGLVETGRRGYSGIGN
ncbi:MAG: phage terminase large subunit [Planctomycetota bacterium]|nr:phage terminase large subunit [Planctomycetota bacterium]